MEMFFKLGYNSFQKNKIINSFIILEITLAMIISIIMTSSILSRFKYYTPFKDYFESKGVFSVFGSAINNDYPIISTGYFKNSLKKVESIAGCYSPWLDSKEFSFNYISYDDEIINKFIPSLANGRWINNTPEVCEAVISPNNENIKVGDTINLFYDNKEVPIKIVGMLNNNAKIVGISGMFGSEYDEKFNYNSFYSTYNTEFEGKPLLIVSKNMSNIGYQVSYPALIKYSDDITEKEIEENHKILSSIQQGFLLGENMEVIKENSKADLFREMLTLLPIIISVISLTIISSISVSALSTKKQLRNYTIYYICGSRWKNCVLINACQSLITIAYATLGTIVTIAVIIRTGLSEKFIFTINPTTIFFSSLILIVYFLISMILPVLIIRKTTPVTILKKN
jgi:hypothetical protein